MNEALVQKIADAVLYEGYILYPYRASVKNRQRWTFGGLHPRAYSEAHGGSDAWSMQAQCLARTDGEAALRVKVRFLHLVSRIVGRLPRPLDQWDEDAEPAFDPVESLQIGDKRYQTWQEATEREVTADVPNLDDLVARPCQVSFAFPFHRMSEPLRGPDGRVVGMLVREQQPIEGRVEVSAEQTDDGLFRLTVRVMNSTALEDADHASRDDALMRSLASTHVVLGHLGERGDVRGRGGEFISLMDPPEPYRAAAEACENIGCWPVLVGEDGEKDTMLASPIILYDYPQIAPESPGDLFDGTEIDEILSLRIMTLTEYEKQEASAIDDRARAMLERTESLGREQLMGLHGTMRNPMRDPWGPGLRTPSESDDPEGAAQGVKLETVRIAGVDLKAGDRVRLRPRSSADAFDLVLNGMTATIATIEQDFEDRIHLAVTVDDDPGADFGQAGKPGHRFFFAPEDVEPLTDVEGGIA